MKERKKTSVFYTKYSDTELIELVKTTKQIGELIKLHDMKNIGSNSRTLRKRLDGLGIDYTHWVKNTHLNPSNVKIPHNQLFVVDSTHQRSVVKRRVISEKLIENKCSICGLHPTWNGNPMILILDHINGINNDNRLENLRLVCPNCNSQLDTHAGKNNKYAAVKPSKLCKCGKEITKTSSKCSYCSNTSRKVNWEMINLPALLLKHANAEQVGKVLGVSGAAVRKRLKKLNNC